VVAPPPNLTVLSGRVLARGPHEALPGWDAVTLAVEHTAAVPGVRDLVSPNLPAPGAGSGLPELVVAVRPELLGDAGPGWHLTVRAKRTPNGPMAEQHPGPDDLVVAPPSGAG